MTNSRTLLALALAASVVAPALGLADAERSVVWLTSDQRPGDAVRLEAEAAGYTLVLADPPTGSDGGARLANARARGRVLGATFTVYVESEGTPTVFVIAADGTIAHAPLSNTRFSQRALALVAMSLVEELGDRTALTLPPGDASAPSPSPTDAAPEPAAPEAEPAQAAPAQAETAPEAAAPVLGAPETDVAPATVDASPETTVAGAVVPTDDAMPTVVVVDAPLGDDVLVDVHSATEPDAYRIAFGVDLIPFVGTSTFTRGRAIRRFSLNVFIGFDRGLEGFELGSLANLHREDVHGVQVAGFLNGVGRDVHGVQLAGLANYAGGHVEGVQASGGLNFAGSIHGAQLAPVNLTRGDVHGVQAGTLNYVGGHLQGVQGGTVNLARGRVDGAQLGLLNVAHGDLGGAQAGLVNIANAYARVQVGLVNVSRDADFAFGLVNIVRDGRTQLEFLGNDGGLVFAGLKHGGRHFHSIYSLGVNAFDGDAQLALGLGYGVRVTPSDRIHLDLDAVAHVLLDNDTGGGNGDVETLGSGRVLLGIRLLERLSLVVGASYDVLHTPRAARTEGFGNFGEKELHDTIDRGGSRVIGWPSLMLGLQVL